MPAGDWILIAVAVVLVVLLWLQNRPRKRQQRPGRSQGAVLGQVKGE